MKTPYILMLEHDDDDRYITKTFFTENHPDINIIYLFTSDELLNHLQECIQKKLPYPAIILLNQNCAPLNPVEILQIIKANKSLAFIPVIVLGNGHKHSFIKDYYVAGASSFIQKPFSHHDTNRTISAFVNYWFKTVEIGDVDFN